MTVPFLESSECMHILWSASLISAWNIFEVVQRFEMYSLIFPKLQYSYKYAVSYISIEPFPSIYFFFFLDSVDPLITAQTSISATPYPLLSSFSLVHPFLSL
jgi:hypothetical protein